MTNLNTDLIEELERLQEERELTSLERELLGNQYDLIEQFTFVETDIYGDMHQY